MPKASLLTDDLRDQLLKELAFGIPISDLAVKYDLKPMQIEYQRGNNSQLYNFYMDFFCIKDEILDWETSDTFRFVLNLLYNIFFQKILNQIIINLLYIYKTAL